MLAEEILQSALNDASDEEDERKDEKIKERPPEVTEEELHALDLEACKHQEAWLEKIGVLEKMQESAAEEPGSYVLTSQMVITRKYRDEQGGWFRRARLVGRLYKWSVFTEDAFASTSASVIKAVVAPSDQDRVGTLHPGCQKCISSDAPASRSESHDRDLRWQVQASKESARSAQCSIPLIPRLLCNSS